MALTHYGADNTYLTINGITIENYGQADPAYTISQTEDYSALIGGVGRSGVRLDNLRTPRSLVVNLMPGSDEVRQLIALQKSGVDITATHRVGGTTETVAMFDGVFVNRGDIGRGGKTSITDEVFTIQFLDSEET